VSEPDLKWRGYIVEVELGFLGRARGQPALSPPARGLGPHPQLVGRGLAVIVTSGINLNFNQNAVITLVYYSSNGTRLPSTNTIHL